jgi:bisphosphoglycerate-dependent phosphoglycerate mutase
MFIPVHCSLRLDEGYYGALQGLNKEATAEGHGKETGSKMAAQRLGNDRVREKKPKG